MITFRIEGASISCYLGVTIPTSYLQCKMIKCNVILRQEFSPNSAREKRSRYASHLTVIDCKINDNCIAILSKNFLQSLAPR